MDLSCFTGTATSLKLFLLLWGKHIPYKSNVAELNCASSNAKVPESTPITEQLTSVAEHLNIKLHEQSKALVAYYQGLPQKYTQLNIAKLHASIDLVLVYFIEHVTETVWTRKHRR